MPSRIGPDDTARVAISGSFGNCAWTNVMWFAVPDSATATDAQAATWLSDVVGQYHTNLMTQLSTSCAATSAEATIFRDGGLVQRASWSGDLGGSHSGGGDMPGNVAMAVSWKTAGYWKGGHPRTYLCGWQLSQTTLMKDWTSGTVTTAVAAALAFLAGVNALTPAGFPTTTFVVMRFVIAGVVQSPGVPVDITGANVDGRIDTQRRRLGKTA